MRVKTAAKINLALDVTGKLPDGYHTLESVFQTVGLYDEVSVELTESGIELGCEVPEEFASADPIPCDERNIAYKAAKLFFEENGMDCGCRIHIKKGIPSQAGMGGGSTDAAAVLYCLGKLTGKSVSASEKLGADVPFFLTGGTAYVEGIGEKITPIADYSGRILVIGKGGEGVSTAEAYRNIDALKAPQHPDAKALAEAIDSAPDTAWEHFGNLFEQAVCLEEVDKLKSAMLNKDALIAVMTGSGSAVFGLFETREQAEICAEKLKKWGYFSAVCETVPESFIII
ncbi:4-(cytidine 5'-diphospho)-2-C-methyl-D-erythritol kinase [Ruminococcus sp.]|uniref:4-(cytidine 5'-diphospho)-2-C-methyl-D-erythritol kinase n=1 Tax=Ruminococcus sp. TaxID=41978 RepID=UPI002C9F6CD9|nr:4-(cytidine 5'-diphospho)-2-C-methyl-D-erythritol kinase [Ruminococcus sp.]HNZ99681.1 4-(cytidine 5'-diphospho)-2-C-methyl-D-erythritol kinase [Ruminococcus sp.]HOH86002.1 4-(cytidine 5'-diphospho)-2-C-methyl-D-erythritol kinase [Ruminococcus sp.]